MARKKKAVKKAVKKTVKRRTPPKKVIKKPAKKKRTALVRTRTRIKKVEVQPEMVTVRDEGFWTPQRQELIRKLCAPKAEADEFAVFMHACKTTGLNPLMRQIYCVHRWSSSEKKYVMTIQVGIDGQRLTAQRTGTYMGQTAPEWFDSYHHIKLKKEITSSDIYTEFNEDGKPDEELDPGQVWVGAWVSVWTKHYHPHAARVGVYKKGHEHPTWGVATWEEFAVYRDGKPEWAWKKMGPTMLAKCAESQANRKSNPMELSGIYVHEEMGGYNGLPTEEQEEKIKKQYQDELTRKSQRVHMLAKECGYTKEETDERLAEYPQYKGSAKDLTIEQLDKIIMVLIERKKTRGTKRGKALTGNTEPDKKGGEHGKEKATSKESGTETQPT